MGEYDTQAFVARRDDTRRGFVWRCARCGRYIGVIEALDGSLEIMHKCGARNRVAGNLPRDGDCSPASDDPYSARRYPA